MQQERYILHIDMDAFFAAIEMRDKIRGLITKYIAVSKKLLK